MNILVVDNDPKMLDLLKHELTAVGHHVDTRRSGTEALMAAIMHDYDLLVCELALPDLQGAEIVRAMKAQTPHLPVIVISSWSPQEWAQPSEDAGATCFLQKPLQMDLLKEEIAFVQMGRVEMKVGIVDVDYIHRVRVSKTLERLGCEVRAWSTVIDALRALIPGKAPDLLLLDAGLEDLEDIVHWARTKRVLVFAFSETVSQADEDRLMRQGVAWILAKPIDCEALVTQARFLAHG